jgi:hypothetical protein
VARGAPPAARRGLAAERVVRTLGVFPGDHWLIEELGFIRIQTGSVLDVNKLIGWYEALISPIAAHYQEIPRPRWSRGRSDAQVREQADEIVGKRTRNQDEADAIMMAAWWREEGIPWKGRT